MKNIRRNFTLLELLVVITIISILAYALGTALGGATEEAKKKQAQAVINGVKTAMSSYYTMYGRPPKKLKDLLKENNSRAQTFFDGNEIPRDPFSLSNDIIKIVENVSAVTKDRKGENITGVELDGNGFLVYSVGPNGKSDGAGSASGGINDGLKDGKDDISIYVSF